MVKEAVVTRVAVKRKLVVIRNVAFIEKLIVVVGEGSCHRYVGTFDD